MTTIGVLEGSLRKASLSRAVARSAAGLVPEGVEVTMLPSTENLPHFNQDVMDNGLPASVTEFGAAVSAIDALLIVTPEYNWSIPGALKNALDWLSRLKPLPLTAMPVAIWTVSPGLLGGARVHESLRQTLHCQDMRIMAKPEIQIGGAKAKVDVEAGMITHADTAEFLRNHLLAFDSFCSSWTGRPE
ncbi:MAG: NADPH-dependent FMN reductase [Roseibium sp.]